MAAVKKEEGKVGWYLVYTFHGHEERTKANLEQRIESLDAKDKIFEVVIPTEQEVRFEGGQKKVVTRKMFPGYLLVKMKFDDETWRIVRNTPGVARILGQGGEPIPLDEKEVEAIFEQMRSGRPRSKTTLSKGDTVKVIEGPFADFIGVVEKVEPERGKVKVLLSFFGRETPVEFDLEQVKKF